MICKAFTIYRLHCFPIISAALSKTQVNGALHSPGQE